MSRGASSSIKPTVISLFSGCGGLDLGFMDAGFKIEWANDNDKHCVQTYQKNIGDIDDRDIRDVNLDRVPKASVLLAGFPCQPFSNAGNRKGIRDSRGNLFFETLRFIEKNKPKVVVFENVRGILSTTDDRGSQLSERIVRELDAVGPGYRTVYRLLNASDYEVPQNRYRVLFVGVAKNIKKDFSFPPPIPQKKLELKHVLKKIPKRDINNEHWELSPQSKKLVVHIPEGGSWKSVPYRYLPPRLKRIKREMKKYRAPNFYRRFSRNEISGTITAAATPENCGIIHPTENRRYTVREVAKIQTFPNRFKFYGSSTASKYRQVGNAVPPKLAFHIASAIKEQIF